MMLRKRRLRVGVCFLLCACGAPQLHAAQAATGKPLEFEAASVRKSAPGARPRGVEFFLPYSKQPPKSGLLSANLFLSEYIAAAYEIKNTGLSAEMRKSLQEWAQQGQYAIEARAEGIPTRAQMMAMLRQLLAERFQLRAHYEMRRLPVKSFVLRVAGRPGPGIVMHPTASPCATEGKEDLCGARTGWDREGRIHVAMIGMDLDGMVEYLAALGGQSAIVVNRTGLAGNYDAHLEYILEVPEGMKLNHPAPSGQLLDEAMEKQLGFKSEKGVEPVRVLVIDHVEPPSEN